MRDTSTCWLVRLPVADEVYACDSAESAMAALLGARYLKIDQPSRAGARKRSAVTTGSRLQAHLMVQAANDGWSIANESEDVQAALMAPRDRPAAPETWDCNVPLVLVASVQTEQVTGNVVLLDDTTDETFLGSLNRVGVIEAFLG